MEWCSWLAQIVETIVVVVLAPIAFWQLSLQRRATLDQATATLHQTIATIISWVQAEEVRRSRKALFDLEKAKTISALPAAQRNVSTILRQLPAAFSDWGRRSRAA